MIGFTVHLVLQKIRFMRNFIDCYAQMMFLHLLPLITWLTNSILSKFSQLPAQRPSLSSLLTDDRSFKPVHLPTTEDASLDSINSIVEDSLHAPIDSDQNSAHTGCSVVSMERPNSIRLDPTVNQNSLSPRLMPKQVTTANMVLITPSSPTKSTESPIINIRSVPVTGRQDANVRFHSTLSILAA